MKKYLFTVLTLAVFAVCFVASDDSDDTSTTPATQSDNKQAKIEAMYKEAYDAGKEKCIKSNGSYFDFYCMTHFEARYYTPTTDEEIEIYNKYKQEYDRGFKDGLKALQKLNY